MSEVNEQAQAEQARPPTAPVPDFPVGGLPERPRVPEAQLQARAHAVASAWDLVGAGERQQGLKLRLETLRARLKSRLAVCKEHVKGKTLTPALELLESTRLLDAVILTGEEAQKGFSKLPHVRLADGKLLPRVVNLAEEYLAAAEGIWSTESLRAFTWSAQPHDQLQLGEVEMLPASLKLAQLEFVLDRADEAFAGGSLPPIERSPFSAPLHSLRRLQQVEWRVVLEPLIPYSATLAQDPAGVFDRMEDSNRGSYYERVAELAAHADATELDTARVALALAQEAAGQGDADPRLLRRRSHIGYFLFEEGLPALEAAIGHHPPFRWRMHRLLRTYNEEFYIFGIFLISLALITALIAPIVPHHAFAWVVMTLFLALLPATQGAADLLNNAVTSLLQPKALPKLDFSKGVPASEAALVVVPTLLLSEEQVRETFEELEARYLANQDPNLHFGLLTDLPDSESRPLPEDRNELVELAVRITEELNARYAGERGGAFVLLHRHRVFNARQGVWMGWERKRGKLLDLNKLFLGTFDSFPVKAGPTERLRDVRYVITLDSDTQLSRGTAARMVGTIAHPLNQAIIDPRLRIVTAGYGILQPRVGVSVASATRSRLAAIYSGETGFDIYTRAVSDVYQDLFGEGIFTGKGIYEVSVLHAVLDRRFPRNALLSHDLIEGAYARAGLVTDIEVIDDYPSHHSAHARRRHRWVRGDWQITRWLSNRVPDESGHLVENPISTISRWKILDNLRRSLVEPVTFLLLVCGWFVLPGGALYWTFVTLLLLVLPALVQFGFGLGRALLHGRAMGIAAAFRTLSGSLGFNLLSVVFLLHGALLSVDAITRSLVRSFVTGKRLLEWETAAQAEKQVRKSSLDRYLQLSPLLSLGLAVLLLLTNRRSLLVAGPILFLWAVAPLTARWLSSSPRRAAGPLAGKDRQFLEQQALRIWRFFAEFGASENHWLIPDNVEEKDTFQVRKLSPTNLGMLFNARQAALEFGFITTAEFAEATLRSLATYAGLEKQRGHIYNWYDLETLRAIPPLTVSAVDSGNLMAALYALHGGAIELLRLPLLREKAILAVEAMLGGRENAEAASLTRGVEGDAERLRRGATWLFAQVREEEAGSGETWEHAEAHRRLTILQSFLEQYTPWLLPRFHRLAEIPEMRDPKDSAMPLLIDAPTFVGDLQRRLDEFLAAAPQGSPDYELTLELRGMLPGAAERLGRLLADVQAIAREAEDHANAMQYGFLLVESRQLLSIGYDGPTGELHPACYDLLASEARIASFLAVAKGDIPQQSWFRLDRSHVLVKGRAVLLSWTGTMFEYLMPSLWMRTAPDTLIARAMEAALLTQQQHVRRIPWGISESGFAETDAQGRYGYRAFGIPALALKYGAEEGPVISPYSTFLALPFATREAVANLRRMQGMGWIGAYGFYEAADYMAGGEPRLVRSWMAHHQGMSLLALTNLLQGNAFQRWFHANPRVRAAELLLQERPLNKETIRALEKQRTAALDAA